MGLPPCGVLYVYQGRVRRWRKRFCVALTPGVLVQYRDETRRSKPVTLNLAGAKVLVDHSRNDRQFMVATPLDASLRRKGSMDGVGPAVVGAGGGAHARVTSDGTQPADARTSLSSAGPSSQSPTHERASASESQSKAMASANVASSFQYFRVLKRPAGLRDAWTRCLQENVAAFAEAEEIAGGAAGASHGQTLQDRTASGRAPSGDEVASPPQVLLDAEVERVMAPIEQAQARAEGALERTRRALAELGLSVVGGEGGEGGAQSRANSSDEGVNGRTNGDGAHLRAPVLTAAQHVLREEVARRLRLQTELVVLRRAVKELSTENFALREFRRQVETGVGDRAEGVQSAAGPNSGNWIGRRREILAGPSAGNSATSAVSSIGTASDGADAEAIDALESISALGDGGDTHSRKDGASVLGEGDGALKLFEAMNALAQREHMLQRGGSMLDSDIEGGDTGSDTEHSNDELSSASDSFSDGSEQSHDYLSRFANVRSRLPSGPPPSSRIAFPQALLRYLAGGDLCASRLNGAAAAISLPCQVNEPLSLLQRIGEEMEHAYLLDAAAAASTVDEAAMWALLFAVAPYGAWAARTRAPFSPALGETFEWASPEGACHFYAEHVGRDPLSSAWHAEGHSRTGKRWRYYGSGSLSGHFSGKDIEFGVHGECVLELYDLPVAATAHDTAVGPNGGGGTPDSDRQSSADVVVLRWSRLRGRLRDVIFGTVAERADFTGELRVESECGASAVATLLPPVTGTANAQVAAGAGDIGGRSLSMPMRGAVSDAAGATQYELVGDLRASIRCMDVGSGESELDPSADFAEGVCGLGGSRRPTPSTRRNIGGGVELWQSSAPPEGLRGDDQYSFSAFAIGLNEPPADGSELPRTDSRFREDMRLMETGDFNGATRAKAALEQRELAAERTRAQRGEKWVPRWFECDPASGEWRSNGKYFEQRRA